MTIVYDKLMALEIPAAEHTYTAKDCILYALGVGLGQDPMNEDELAFVYEKNLKVLPTMGAVLGYPGFWVRDRDTGIDWVQHRQRRAGLALHQPLKPHRHRRRQAAHPRSRRQGRGQRRAGLHRAQGDRQGDRRADRDRDADHVLPRRRRLRRSAAHRTAAASDPERAPDAVAISARARRRR